MKDLIAGLFSWWGGELAAMLPPIARRWLAIEPDLLVVALEGDIVDVTHDRAGSGNSVCQIALGEPDTATQLAKALGDVRLAHLPVALRLAADQVLQKDVFLPAAANENLRQVLSFEMEQQTPFRADQVFYDGAVRGRDTSGDKIVVSLAAAPRDTVDRALAEIGRLGLTPAVVGVGREGGAFDRCLNLTADNAPKRAGLPRRDRLLLTIVIVLLVTVLVIPGLLHDRVRADIEDRIARVTPAANQALALQQRIHTALAGVGTVVQLKRQAPSPVRLLEELSLRLPDDTWLAQWNLDGADIEIEGTSPSAAHLVEILEASPLIASVEFRTPITRDNLTNREHFSLALRATVP